MKNLLPYLVGLLIATLLILGGNAADRYFRRHPPSRRAQAALLAMFSLTTSAMSLFLAFMRDWGNATSYEFRFPFLCTISFTVLFGCSALGQLHEWPGFREPADPEAEFMNSSLFDAELDDWPDIVPDP